jgi:chromosome segregation ATPase
MDENFENALEELKSVRRELEWIHEDLRYELFDFHEDLEALQQEHQELQDDDEENLFKYLPFHPDEEVRQGLEERRKTLLERHGQLQMHNKALEELQDWNEGIDHSISQ